MVEKSSCSECGLGRTRKSRASARGRRVVPDGKHCDLVAESDLRKSDREGGISREISPSRFFVCRAIFAVGLELGKIGTSVLFAHTAAHRDQSTDNWRYQRGDHLVHCILAGSLSWLPKFAGQIVNMPRPVMAAALFFNGALMLVAGMQIIASRPITLRARLVIGFSILAALTVAERYFRHPGGLHYAGNLQTLPDERPKREMVEEQSFVSGLSGYLSGLHADRLERSAKGEQCEIKLLFRL